MTIDDLIVDVYEVYTGKLNNLQGDLVGVFSTYELAYNAAKGKGLYETSGLIKGAKGIILGDKVYVLKYGTQIINQDIINEKSKELDNILSKLTDEEIKKLNIDKDKLKKDQSNMDSSDFFFNIPA